MPKSYTVLYACPSVNCPYGVEASTALVCGSTGLTANSQKYFPLQQYPKKKIPATFQIKRDVCIFNSVIAIVPRPVVQNRELVLPLLSGFVNGTVD